MKKWLLGTSALIGAVAVASSAQAQLEVTLGGELDFRAAHRSQDNPAASTRSTVFTNDTEIHLGVEGKADNGLVYGAVVELNADESADGGANAADVDGGNSDKTYIFIESDLGRVEMGANVGPTKTLKVDASTIAAGAGGIDNDFDEYINNGATNLKAGTGAFGGTGTANSYIYTPDLLVDSLEATEDANKITYYTPRVAGVQFGISYAPDLSDTGTIGAASGDTATNDYEEVFQTGLNFTGDLDGVGVQASATYERAELEAVSAGAANDLEAYAIGVGVDLEGIQLAGSYGDIGDSLGDATDGTFYTLGAAFGSGPLNASITYLSSEYEEGVGIENEFDNLVFGVDYQLAPGLTPYVDVSFFEAEDGNAAANNNEGTVIFLGTALNF